MGTLGSETQIRSGAHKLEGIVEVLRVGPCGGSTARKTGILPVDTDIELEYRHWL